MNEVNIIHSSGAEATVHPFGATLTSYKTKTGREIIFVSSLAKRDGSKAIRGGIPLVFPQFGQELDKEMRSHGFLRCNLWKSNNMYEDKNGAACCDFSLSLKNVVEGRNGKWSVKNTDIDCEVVLTVKVTAYAIRTILNIHNTGNVNFDFQTLFHTYFRVEGGQALNKSLCNVKGLVGYSVEDKVTMNKYIQKDEDVFVDKEVDRIFVNPSKGELDLVLSTTASSKIQIQAKAFIDEMQANVSVVIWNPFIEKSKRLSDFDDDEYHNMICVEPGLLREVPSLEPSKKAVFEQIISVLN